jgi:hypothetical protein
MSLDLNNCENYYFINISATPLQKYSSIKGGTEARIALVIEGPSLASSVMFD